MKSSQDSRYAGALRSVAAAGLLACGTMFGSAAQAAITFDFQFDAGTTAAQQQAIIAAGDLFSNMFATHFSDTAVLSFAVNSVADGLASAGSAAGPDTLGFGNSEIVRNKLVSGGTIDLNGSATDGFININWATNFQLDPNAPVNFAAGQIDLFSVLDHELTHAFGFGSNIDADGNTPGAYSKWDQFLTTMAGVSIVNSDGSVNHAAYLDAQTNGALFNGTNAIAAWGSPVPLVVGSDISHLNTNAFSSPNVPQNALMLCCGGANVSFEPRDYNAAETGIMADLGYRQVTVTTPVPEPSTYALMFAGLGALGFAAKCRKSQPPSVV